MHSIISAVRMQFSWRFWSSATSNKIKFKYHKLMVPARGYFRIKPGLLHHFSMIKRLQTIRYNKTMYIPSIPGFQDISLSAATILKTCCIVSHVNFHILLLNLVPFERIRFSRQFTPDLASCSFSAHCIIG